MDDIVAVGVACGRQLHRDFHDGIECRSIHRGLATADGDAVLHIGKFYAQHCRLDLVHALVETLRLVVQRRWSGTDGAVSCAILAVGIDLAHALGERRILMLERLRASSVPCNQPQGAFFVFADIRATGLSSFDFCVRLVKEAQVLVFPGTQYGDGGEGFVRISFLASLDQVAEALERFGKFYHALAGV